MPESVLLYQFPTISLGDPLGDDTDAIVRCPVARSTVEYVDGRYIISCDGSEYESDEAPQVVELFAPPANCVTGAHVHEEDGPSDPSAN